jgi:hypothetical protein
LFNLVNNSNNPHLIKPFNCQDYVLPNRGAIRDKLERMWKKMVLLTGLVMPGGTEEYGNNREDTWSYGTFLRTLYIVLMKK